MGDGWLLDVSDARDGSGVVLWLKERATGRVEPRRETYRPPFFVHGARIGLERVARRFAQDPAVEQIDWRRARPSLFDARERRLLAVTVRRNFQRRRVATAIDAMGEYRAFTLLDVDLSAPQLYHLTHGLYPFAPVTWTEHTLTATEPAETVDYESPPLRIARLGVTLSGGARGGIVPAQAHLTSIRLGDATLEGEEAALLTEFHRELTRQDPDLLLTDGGDAFDLPWIYRRAEANALTERDFYLGREPAAFRPSRPARSFETYGQVLHRDASFPLPGRFHVDEANSFLFDDASVEGLIDAARLSRLSLQTVVRQSPGTCFTAMEMAHALAEGVHVPWKKNRPEEFKSARTLLAADRGGVILLPPVGVHDHVEEFDFASLYPHIMV
ncbi:MAG TPA: hypothetical protein VN180_12530, partial [Acidimicrobiia bacterium]|nr:hypothetical protein [Acidimicrobiia bacterium]